jgi:4-diphosphocytidyl-2-C-methyl-D-erythritol kinase
VAELLRERAPAKVNLTLRVGSRRGDGYHELESLVAFADLADVVTFDADAPPDIEVTGPFAAATGPAGENLVLEAARLMRLDHGRFTLEKNIPVAAGLGGGSADAAAALRLIARERSTDTDNPRIRDAARRCGADVPVCLVPKARIMRGIGDVLSPPIAIPQLPVVLVNPNVELATRDVFGAMQEADRSSDAIVEVPGEPDSFVAWLAQRSNDLTRAATARVPAIREMLDLLAALPGCQLARMSGSGATCFGVFASADQARLAAERLQSQRSEWWVSTTTLR